MKSKILMLLFISILIFYCITPNIMIHARILQKDQPIKIHMKSLFRPHRKVEGTQYNLQPGDIVWRWSFIPFITHCMLYIGMTDDDRYEFIEANSVENIWRPSYDEEWINTELFDLIVRVIADQRKINDAIEFAKDQVGKKFAYIHEKQFDPDTEYWYCTEIIWAAFYSQDIDIDFNGWGESVIFQAPVILPYEMYFDDDVELYQLHLP